MSLSLNKIATFRNITALTVLTASALVLTSVLSLPNVLPAEEDRPPIVIVVSESTRADHVGPCYGYERETAPNICKLAQDGVKFQNAYSQGSWTPVALPVFLTSMNPRQVGLDHWQTSLSKDVTTFTEILDEEGYKNRVRNRKTDLVFTDVFQGLERKKNLDIPEDEQFLNFYFIYEHAHYPYTPDSEFRKWDNISAEGRELERKWRTDEFANRTVSKQKLIDLYDGDIHQMDSQVGDVIEELKEKGIYNDALIIYTSDHGQKFGEYTDKMAWHGGYPDPIVTHVPLVIKFPDNQHSGKKINASVRLVDVSHTLLDFLEIEKDFEDFGNVGESLIPLLEGEELDLTAFSAGTPQPHWSIITTDKYYLLHNVQDVCIMNKSARERLFWKNSTQQTSQPVNQPGSEFEISDEHPETVKEFREKLCDKYRTGTDKLYNTKETDRSEEVERRLKELGYLS